MAPPSPSHGDLQRDMGRMEGKQDSMGARMDRLERTVLEGQAEIKETLGEISDRLRAIEGKEQERKGAWRALVAISSLFSGVVAAVVTYWLKGTI